MRRVAHVPLRMCVGCGARAAQATLMRFAPATDGTLVVVAPRATRGRTGYLHPKPACWERFAARGGPVRSLRRNIDRPQRLTFVQELKAAEHSAMVR